LNRAGKPPFEWAKQVAYSQSVAVDGTLVFSAGQAGLDERGDVVAPGDFEGQLRQAFRNLATVLEAQGASLATVVKITVYLLRLSDYDTFKKVRSEVFSAPYPASTAILAGGLLLPGMLVELDAVAAVGQPRS
jgi:2-iminobutanoate/2-iminopropanoate deaminase